MKTKNQLWGWRLCVVKAIAVRWLHANLIDSGTVDGAKDWTRFFDELLLQSLRATEGLSNPERNEWIARKH